MLRTDQKRILGPNHHFDNRRVAPFGRLVRQVIKGRPVDEGEEEEDGVRLLPAGLDGKQLFEYFSEYRCVGWRNETYWK